MTRLFCCGAAALLPLLSAHSAGAQGSQDAYLDARAASLAEGARQRRLTVDQSILEYQTQATERISAGYRVLGRDRLLFRRETAANIHWRRTGAIEIEVIGAREVVPVAISKVQVPEDLPDFMPHIAFDPMDSDLLIRLDTTDIIHPLSAIGERNYRFQSGDSSTIRLPDGRAIRLHELEFIPRRRDPNLIAGSFWVESESHAIVQAVFRLARAFDFTRDSKEGEDAPPAWLQPFGMDLTHMAVDYGLYDLRWWLPRTVSAEGIVRIGALGTVPLSYERTYSDYVVSGDTLATRIARDSAVMRGCTPTTSVRVSVSSNEDDPDSATVSRREERRLARMAAADSAARADSIAGKRPTCAKRDYVITRAADEQLLASEALPPSIYAGETLLSESERDAILDRVRGLPDVPWQIGRPRFALGYGGPGLIRYNRVESVSIGARGQVDFGRLTASAEARYGIADEKVSGELSLQRETTARLYRIGGYHRLSATDPNLRPFTFPASVNALFLGHDDAKYFRASGAELHVAPASALRQWYALRLYAERQADVDRNTDFSLRHLLDESHVFSSNIEASPAEQVGAVLSLRHDFGLDPASVRSGVELRTRAETGTFEFTQPALTLRASAPILGLTVGLEGSAGTTFGTAPAQSIWYLGGHTSVRGYDYDVLRGNTYWRGRGEVATSLPAVRIALFSDAGWAGTRQDFDRSTPLLSAGVGASLLDGIVRVDIARALRSPTGWRVHIYTGGIL